MRSTCAVSGACSSLILIRWKGVRCLRNGRTAMCIWSSALLSTQNHFEGKRMGTPLPLLNCIRTHYGRHCEPSFGQICSQIACIFIYDLNIFLGWCPGHLVLGLTILFLLGSTSYPLRNDHWNRLHECGLLEPVTDLERGGRAGFAPPPLVDRLTPSITVLLICDNGTVLWRHYRQFISSST